MLHFLALGAALFLVFAWKRDAAPGGRRIVITPGQLDSLSSGFAKTWLRPPTDAEMKGLLDEWVREEIAVREAMAAGLDRDDTVVRRRLRQKLEFLVEETADAAPPTEAELAAYLASHAADYRQEPKVAFRQVFVSPARRGARAGADARALLATLRGARGAARPDALGDASMLPAEMPLAPRRETERTFGAEFAKALDALPVNRWEGPIASGYGLHLVLVTERADGAVPALAVVRQALERDFLAARRKRQLDEAYRKLLAGYDVVVEKRKDAR